MKHFEEIRELITGILAALGALTTQASEALGAGRATVLVIVALTLALAFAAFMACRLEDLAERVLHEFLAAALAAPWARERDAIRRG